MMLRRYERAHKYWWQSYPGQSVTDCCYPKSQGMPLAYTLPTGFHRVCCLEKEQLLSLTPILTHFYLFFVFVFDTAIDVQVGVRISMEIFKITFYYLLNYLFIYLLVY